MKANRYVWVFNMLQNTISKVDAEEFAKKYANIQVSGVNKKQYFSIENRDDKYILVANGQTMMSAIPSEEDAQYYCSIFNAIVKAPHSTYEEHAFLSKENLKSFLIDSCQRGVFDLGDDPNLFGIKNPRYLQLMQQIKKQGSFISKMTSIFKFN